VLQQLIAPRTLGRRFRRLDVEQPLRVELLLIRDQTLQPERLEGIDRRNLVAAITRRRANPACDAAASPRIDGEWIVGSR
jgi:hypothetical protein